MSEKRYVKMTCSCGAKFEGYDNDTYCSFYGSVREWREEHKQCKEESQNQ